MPVRLSDKYGKITSTGRSGIKFGLGQQLKYHSSDPQRWQMPFIIHQHGSVAIQLAII